MVRPLLSLIVVSAAMTVVGHAQSANAQGIHFGAGPVHVDVGNPHYSPYSYYPRASHAYGGYGGYGGYRSSYRPAWSRHSDWHDTTHLDYHRGGLEPHYDHYHYVPRHYDVHHSGHWDSHH